MWILSYFLAWDAPNTIHPCWPQWQVIAELRMVLEDFSGTELTANICLILDPCYSASGFLHRLFNCPASLHLAKSSSYFRLQLNGHFLCKAISDQPLPKVKIHHDLNILVPLILLHSTYHNL